MTELLSAGSPLPGEPPIRPLIVDGRYVEIPRSVLEEELQCAVCKGVPRTPVTLKVCLHRLCQSCFERLHTTKVRTAGKDRIERMQCPICKAELSSKRVAILDHDYDMLIRALFDPSLLTTSSSARNKSNMDSDADEDDDDDIRALIAQAQQIKQDSLREATKKVLRGRKDYTPAMEHFEPVPSRKSRTSAGVAASSTRVDTNRMTGATKRAEGVKPSQKQEYPSKGVESIARLESTAGVKRPRLIVEADNSSGRRTSRYENGELVRCTLEGLLHADVLALVLQLPSENRLPDQMWPVRCCGAATLEFLQHYVTFRLREIDGKLGVLDTAKVAADGSSIRFYVGTKDLLTVQREITDMSTTLASLYMELWQDIEIPLMLYFGLAI